MLARACVLLLVVVQTFFAFLLVAGHSRFSGHTLLKVSPDHGLNGGDVPVLVLYLVSMICYAVIWVKAKPR